MKIDDIIVMWEADSHINEHQLDNAAIYTSKLHAKYLKLLIDAKLKLSKLQFEFNSLRKNKFRYYRGEMTQAELNSHGWEQWQYSKPLKNEMDEFLKGDGDLNQIQARIEYIESLIYMLESIMTQLKSRDFQISNAIKWKQFLAGT
jgi:predicted DNA-binding transcriptional regulator YafY